MDKCLRPENISEEEFASRLEIMKERYPFIISDEGRARLLSSSLLLGCDWDVLSGKKEPEPSVTEPDKEIVKDEEYHRKLSEVKVAFANRGEDCNYETILDDIIDDNLDYDFIVGKTEVSKKEGRPQPERSVPEVYKLGPVNAAVNFMPMPFNPFTINNANNNVNPRPFEPLTINNDNNFMILPKNTFENNNAYNNVIQRPFIPSTTNNDINKITQMPFEPFTTNNDINNITKMPFIHFTTNNNNNNVTKMPIRPNNPRLNNTEVLERPTNPNKIDFGNNIAQWAKSINSPLDLPYFDLSLCKNNEIYRCTYSNCDQEFRNESDLMKHVDRDHKIFKCRTCTQGYAKKQSLIAHIEKEHQNISKYECDYCRKRYTSQASLNSHVRSIHTREPFYKCIYCEEMFITKYDYSKHKQTHESQK